MKAKIKFFYHSCRWYLYKSYRFIAAGPILLIGWAWEYCRLVKNVWRGFSSVLDVPEIALLLFKGLFATLVLSYRNLKKHWKMRSAWIEQEVERLSRVVPEAHFKTWYLESRLQMKRYLFETKYGNLEIVQRGLLDVLRDRFDPPIEGEYRHVSKDKVVG